MLRRRWILLLIVALAAFAVWAVWIADDGRGLFARRGRPPDYAALLAKLDQPVNLAADAQPLSEILDELARQHGVEIHWDEDVMGSRGWPKTVPITVQAEGISLRSAIAIVLRLASDKLATVVDGETLLVTDSTTAFNDPQYYVGRVHRLSPLYLPPSRVPEEELATTIKAIVKSWTWTPRRGKAEIEPLPGALAVAHTVEVQEQIEALLTQLQRVADAPENFDPVNVGESAVTGNQRALGALDRPITVHLSHKSLRDVCHKLTALVGVPVLLDTKPLNAELACLSAKPGPKMYVPSRRSRTGRGGSNSRSRQEIPPEVLELNSVVDWKISLRAEGQRLEDVLQSAVHIPGIPLKTVVRDEAIWLTPRANAFWEAFLRLYPVGDLLTHMGDPLTSYGSERRREISRLASVVQTVTFRDATPGTPVATMGHLGNTLIVVHQRNAHRKIEMLLSRLREMLGPSASEASCGLATGGMDWDSKLAEKTSIDAHKRALSNVLKELERKHSIRFAFDRVSLSEFGFGKATAVTCQAENVALEQALLWLLSPQGLRFVTDDDRLLITTAKGAARNPETRLYDVRHLIDPDVGITNERQVGELLQAFSSTWGPQRHIGGGTLFRGIFVMAQEREALDDVESLFDALTKYQQRPPSTATIPVLPRQHAGGESIDEALEQVVEIEYRNVPLDFVAADLSRRFGVPIAIDHLAVRNVLLDNNLLVTVAGPPMTLDTALRLMLRPLGLSFHVLWGQLVITSSECAAFTLDCRIYPVADLTAPVPPERLPQTGSGESQGGRAELNYRRLSSILRRFVRAGAWEDDSDMEDPFRNPWQWKRGSVTNCRGALVVTQPRQVHRDVERMLAQIRHARWPQQHPKPEPSRSERTEKLLGQPTTLRADGTPLARLLEDIGRRHSMAIETARVESSFHRCVGMCLWLPRPASMQEPLVNEPVSPYITLYEWLWRSVLDVRRARHEAGGRPPSTPGDPIGPLQPHGRIALKAVTELVSRWHLELSPLQLPVDAQLEDMPLGDVLVEILDPLGLQFYVDGELLGVCPVAEDIPLLTRIYDLQDLVPPAREEDANPSAQIPGRPLPPRAGGSPPLPRLKVKFDDFVTDHIFPGVWESGNPAIIGHDLFLVRQSWYVQREVRRALKCLSQALRDLPPVDQMFADAEAGNVDPLLQMAGEMPDDLARAYLVFLLRCAQPPAETAVPSLIESLRQADPEANPAFHDALCDALGVYGQDAGPALPLFAARLTRCPQPQRRVAILRAMGRQGEAAGASLAEYVNARVPDPGIHPVERRALFDALTQAGPTAADALESLLWLLAAPEETSCRDYAPVFQAIDPGEDKLGQIISRWKTGDEESKRKMADRVEERMKVIGDPFR